MTKLIKMDLYRLFHSKAIKVGAVASLVICAASMLLGLGIVEIMKYALDEDPSVAMSLSQIFPIVNWINGVDFAEVVLYGASSFSLFVGCMISASFIGAEQSCGYIKNVAGQLPNRGYTVISKFVTTAFVHLLVLLFYTAISCVLAFVLFSGYIQSYSIGNLIASLALKLLLYWALNSAIVFLCTMTKSNAIAMVTGAIFGTGITGLVYMGAGMLLRVAKIDITLANYMPDGINSLLNANNAGELAIRGVIVSAAFITVFLGGAYLLIKKRDVK